MADIWKSERLIYRGVEEEDMGWIEELGQDAESLVNSIALMPVPPNKKGAKRHFDHLQNLFMTGIICLPATGPDQKSPIPVGVISLRQDNPMFTHHRVVCLGITLLGKYQGKGYGGEAIDWALNWAFTYAGIHKVWLETAAYNPRAIHLYRRVGFQQEGLMREQVYSHGQHWDILIFGMLARDWQQMKQQKAAAQGNGTQMVQSSA